MPDSGARILYIDDDPAVRRLVERGLKREGFIIESAEDGESGLDRLTRGGIDVVCLDHELPGGTGLEILQQIRARDDAPPVLYVTGSTDTKVAVDALKSGADDYVPKDLSGEFIALLAASICQALEKARLRAARDKADLEMRQALERSDLLLREVNHRVANSLALVAGMVHMQSMLVSKEAQDVLAETHARIMAIAGVHRRLYTSEDVTSVRLDEYLQALIIDLESSTVNRGCALTFSATPASVRTDLAVSIGIIATELITNACKYAYPAGHEGAVRVALSRVASDRVNLVVEDDGIGWSGQGKPKGTGLGTRIVRAVAQNLGTSLEYASDHPGTRVTFPIPL